MRFARGILAGLVVLGVAGVVQAQSLTAGAPKVVAANSQQSQAGRKSRPNILFIIMDDVGIDQMSIFGYGGLTPPLTPNINAVARAGVRFRNVWSMPECSPSRAIFFEGRYPVRTNVNSAILADDLANSQVSPFEVTTPKILKKVGYENALFGKFHLAGPDNNPFERSTPHILGWDYFDGFLEGAPHPIDTSIGGQFTDTSSPQSNSYWYTCGFIPNTQQSAHGADTGACRFANSTCSVISKDATHPTPGFSCLQSGGIFVPNATCQSSAGQNLNFDLDNAYYVWNRVINEADGTVIPADENAPPARGYVSDQTTQSAVDWIRRQDADGQTWMATVSYANAHTPYQQSPRNLLPIATPDSAGFACTGNSTANVAATRIISNQMIEAMDTEVGNLLVQSGLATMDNAGRLQYDPTKNNTMVVIIGDNGTFAPGVKVPFDSNRAKGYVYQTGVWVPLIVSGPVVASPGREVTSMVNIADLFQLFGEFAGVDVHKAVPKSHILDSQSMLPYLTNVNQPSIRQTNFTQTSGNIHLNDMAPPPCVITLTMPPTCVQLFPQRQLCNFEGGDWYGPDQPAGGVPYASCCEVQRAGIYKDQNGNPATLTLFPVDQAATRNDQFKLVRKTVTMCGADTGGDTNVVQTELYPINENANLPALDKDGDSLCGENCPAGLTGSNLATFNALANSMTATLMSEPSCKGDGNEDKKVNVKDIADWLFFNLHDGLSSWYDFNHDGKTDSADLKQYILPNLGTNCLKK
ncbi:MAG TPA: sulfatase-like hydrolase/transferase [Silvibacterium sp.]|nr:sulfatase-like hydrolase/transferase [Silvibacterium sp.]